MEKKVETIRVLMPDLSGIAKLSKEPVRFKKKLCRKRKRQDNRNKYSGII
jgi:hypothetical protein